MDTLVVMYGDLPLSVYVLYTQMMSPHGYSWFDGLLRNPRSGVQTPQVLGYSPIRAALILGSGVQTPTRGWGPTGYTGKVCAQEPTIEGSNPYVE